MEETNDFQSLQDLIEISRYSGMRLDLVQAGGGNSSVKLDDRRMAVKASGFQLADVTECEGYAIVNYAMIWRWMDGAMNPQSRHQREDRQSEDADILSQATMEGGRPSIETFLHAVAGRVTLHTHPVSVCALASRSGGMGRLAQLFPEAIMVGYATPGVDLARLYYKAYLDAASGKESCKKGSVIFLKNHGLVVSGNSAEEVIRLTEQVNEAVEREVGMDNSAYRKAYEIYQWLGDGQIVFRVENVYVLEAYAAFGHKLWDYQICPDCVVFCGREPFDYDAPDREGRLREHAARYGMPVLVTSGEDLFIRADSVRKAREIEDVLSLAARVAMANRRRDVDTLSAGDQEFLLGWDAEKYRRGK